MDETTIPGRAVRSRVAHIDQLLEGGQSAGPPDGSLWTRRAYGSDLSIAVASRPGGYHSSPHAHDSEQLTYCADGEISIYVDGAVHRLRKGDFLRVPRMAPHWAWNRSSDVAVLFSSHCPGHAGAAAGRKAAAALFEADEAAPPPVLSQTIWLSPEYADEAERDERPGIEGHLLIRQEQLKDSVHVHMSKAGRLTSKFVHGLESNMMIATRAAGYHSQPHIHDCEQLNYLVAGELWIFLSDTAYHLRAGDFMRVPRLAPHWAWNPIDQPCSLFEAHAPVLEPGNKSNACALLAPSEVGLPIRSCRNLWAPPSLAAHEDELMRQAERSDA